MTDKDKKTPANPEQDTTSSSATKGNDTQANDKSSAPAKPAPEKNSGNNNIKTSEKASEKVSAADAAKIAAQAKAQAKPEQATSKGKRPEASAASKSTSSSAASGNKKPPTKPPARAQVEKSPGVSKTGVLALLIAIAAAGGVGYLYQQQQQELQSLTEQLNQQFQSEQDSNNQQLSRQVTEQINSLKQSSQQSNRNLANELSDKNEQQQQELLAEVEQLNGKISRLTAQQPSNWRVFEAEYLLRMASRVIWLEHDVNTAISLLDDADARLASMKQTRFMPIRKMIREDKQMLRQLPEDNTQDVLLALLALNDSTDSLVIKGADKKVEVPPEEMELSDDISDWESNLRVSWQRFVADFITVRNKYDKDEPLMEPQYQQHLLQNLQLKLQVSQYAVTQQQPELYQKSLADVEQWLDTYFDDNNDANKAFKEEIASLKKQNIAIEYPQDLKSQQALREMLDQNFSASTRAMTQSRNSKASDEPGQAPEQQSESSPEEDDNKKPQVENESPGNQEGEL
ncbi:uroporphyrinogen-III C-methyltransferase [Thalassotalea sp. PS06]|uniref:uroporphyrinogen-III C-methyltransferase n=1 Tax=Thalassotalea sp. PS06 TaxID=2594005 RepID=UPI001163B118|nr:uroporphyrinogen-III C-methyltransferase [Thalassotalea sp. PS06]QDP02583.1 hypothetical protein FNC98_15255 [Thalassotalea sp. PS06]